MHIYFSGIGGVGLGPLAEIARDAGHVISGSDLSASPTFLDLQKSGFNLSLDQSGQYLAATHASNPLDWFVYTAALPPSHPELVAAQKLGINCTKRDGLLNVIVDQSDKKLVAIAGTHGKTTTTAMIVWLFFQLRLPVSYLIGAPMAWRPSGAYNKDSSYFVYECDEFDRNFLKFKPYLSAITSLGYDHPDTYPDQKSYDNAFDQFKSQSQTVVCWNEVSTVPITLPGAHNRSNGALAVEVVARLTGEPAEKLTPLLNVFPGTSRRFEKLSENIYSDYAHHPEEIAATLELASELSSNIVAVYQPHQNVRQHRLDYSGCFDKADKVYWLPTYLSREDPSLPILSPQQVAQKIDAGKVVFSDMNMELANIVRQAAGSGKLVLIMGAGSIDSWARQEFQAQ